MKNILCVEDSKAIRLIIARTLSTFGYTVIDAADGVVAQGILSSQKIDLVVTDLNMPNMNGFDLTRWIRSNAGQNKDVPVILLTNDITKENKLEADAAGVTAWLDKPFSVDDFKKLIHKLLEK